MFTLVTGDLGIVGRWRDVCVTALQRPNSDAAAIRIVVGIAAASLCVTERATLVFSPRILFSLRISCMTSPSSQSVLQTMAPSLHRTSMCSVKTTCPYNHRGNIKLVAGGQDSPDRDRCRVVFRAPHNQNILLNLMQLSSASCDHCSLMVYDGESHNKTFKARLTKEKIPITMKSIGSAITIVFGGSAQGSELQLWLSYSLP
ncbi:unnamed protein product [Ranitomeya imitator]|uniref:CUB domain-containing protein n=1 Tax=Ranitomeya imitator TaxID=111125 RepID=A0ABN9MTG2_9NEOB|nr:unnamed protein product [Ranitomeya imitator]